LRAELALLDHARGALASGDTATAFDDLRTHEHAFPHGPLTDEAALLHIEALAQSGSTDGAIAEAKRLLARDGAGPHARRVRAWLAAHGAGFESP
jgi:hypothetical protein